MTSPQSKDGPREYHLQELARELDDLRTGRGDFLATQLREMLTRHTSLKTERDGLAEAIVRIAKRLGMTDANRSLTGPEVLFLLHEIEAQAERAISLTPSRGPTREYHLLELACELDDQRTGRGNFLAAQLRDALMDSHCLHDALAAATTAREAAEGERDAARALFGSASNAAVGAERLLEDLLTFIGVGLVHQEGRDELQNAKQSITGLRERIKFTESFESEVFKRREAEQRAASLAEGVAGLRAWLTDIDSRWEMVRVDVVLAELDRISLVAPTGVESSTT